MTKQEYSEALNDWRWKEKRNLILIRDKYTCRICSASHSENNELHIHHIYYGSGMPWEVADEALRCVCSVCHKRLHDSEYLAKVKNFLIEMKTASPYSLMCMHDALERRNVAIQEKTEQKLGTIL